MANLLPRLVSLLMLSLALAPVAIADVLSDIQQRGTIRVGVALFSPWTMQGKDGRLAGFEIDMAEMIAADLGLRAEFVLLDWEKTVPSLQSGAVDMIAAGMAITAQRALTVNFSRPYMTSGVSLATNTEKTSHIKKMQDLNQSRVVIASVTDTLAAGVATRLFDKATHRHFATNKEAEAAVLNGSAHGYLASVPEVRFFVLANPGKIDLPVEKPLIASKAGFAVKKGEHDWLNVLDAWIVAREADGTLETAYNYWFRSLAWQSRVR